MGKLALTPPVLSLLAARFKALAEPARLSILNSLRTGELTVGELVERTELSQTNVSRHLQMLHGLSFVARRKEGLYVYYRLADPGVFALCDLMCGRLDAELQVRHKVLTR